MVASTTVITPVALLDVPMTATTWRAARSAAKRPGLRLAV